MNKNFTALFLQIILLSPVYLLCMEEDSSANTNTEATGDNNYLTVSNRSTTNVYIVNWQAVEKDFKAWVNETAQEIAKARINGQEFDLEQAIKNFEDDKPESAIAHMKEVPTYSGIHNALRSLQRGSCIELIKACSDSTFGWTISLTQETLQILL